MEITTIDKKNGIKIKGKQASIVLDPSNTVKVAADAVMSLQRHANITGNIEGSRLIIHGSGEYEIGGIKVSAISSNESLVYRMRVDGLDIGILSSELIDKMQEKLGECQILVVRIDNKIDESVLTPFSPRIVVLYGEQINEELLKGFEKEQITTSPKLQTAAEKLPEQLSIVVLQ